MTKTGIIALLIVIASLVIIGVVGFIFAKVRFSPDVTIPPQEKTVEITPSPTVGENEATPAAVINPLPSGVLPGKEATPSAQRVEVIISKLSFQPASITVGKGSTIVWRNQDTVSHTVTAVDGSFNSGTVVAGDTFVQRFDKVKTYTYSCSIHPEMKGTIIVE
jgi:plastocyanin